MEKRKILIIDDEQHSREMCRILLSKYSDIEVMEAVDGGKGVELAKLERPSLVLLDNKMPTVSGEQVAKLLRSNPVTKSIPIIMMTAMKLTQGEINLIKLDVDEVVLKPFSPWELVSKIEQCIGSLVEEL